MMLQFLSALLLVLTLGTQLFAASARKMHFSKPIAVLQGEIVELQISADGLTAIEATMGKEPVYFFPAENGSYRALIGADVEAKPGLAKVLVRGFTASGAARERQIEVRINAKAFKKESFTVAQEYDQFTPELLERIRREQEQFAGVFGASAPKPFWERPFIAPVPIEITSPFGYRRVINGTPRSPHTGTDLKAAAGTEIAVSNHGRVVLTGDFYFAGKSVVVDHGAGLFTMYFHLSELKVEQGAEVRKGDVIALSGMSGRVTGPHLHWAARVSGARVDPLELIERLGGRGNQAAPAAGGKAEKNNGEERPAK
jgi:murein DD-endopeptidase MepM/ murein hydrolase activator NlpD